MVDVEEEEKQTTLQHKESQRRKITHEDLDDAKGYRGPRGSIWFLVTEAGFSVFRPGLVGLVKFSTTESN